MKVDAIKAAQVTFSDRLATVAERLPGLSQATISAGGVTLTVAPKPAPPPPPKVCEHCGASKP